MRTFTSYLTLVFTSATVICALEGINPLVALKVALVAAVFKTAALSIHNKLWDSKLGKEGATCD